MEKADRAASQAQERPIRKGNHIAKTTSMTEPGSVKANTELLPESNNSHVPHLPRSRSLPSARTAFATEKSVARETISLGPACVAHEASKKILHSSAVGRLHHPNQKKSGERCQSKPQNFKIYSNDTSFASRQRIVAMDVSKKATQKSSGGLENGIYVPRYAASGLIMTTVQGVADRSKLSRQWSQKDPLKSGTNPKALKIIPVNASPKESTPEIKHCARQCNNAMPANTSPTSTVVDGGSQRCEHTKGTGETTKPRLGSVAEDVLPAGDERMEREQRQRRTLRAKISSMMILNRRKSVEKAASLSEEPLLKPTVSRRKSMLVMFG